MIKKVEFSFGTVYLVNNKVKTVRYNCLTNTEAHPSICAIKQEYFDDEKNKSYFEDGIYGYGKYDILPFWFNPIDLTDKDEEFVKRELPEYYL